MAHAGAEGPLILLSAGEASGDRHAASLYLALKKQRPEVRAIGMGGAAMRAAGIDVRVDSSGIGVIGLAEIARHYGDIKRALEAMRKLAKSERPDLLICVDYKEFNFRLARSAKALGIKVLFYVSPQVWAWRPGRVKKYGEIIDHMAVIFPFELPFYERYGIPATYVGHPLKGKVKALRSPEVVRQERGYGAEEHPLIGLLPGSRSNEISRLLPVILAAAGHLQARYPRARFVLFKAPSLDGASLRAQLDASGLRADMVEGQDYDLLQCCDAVMTVSGTATLEVALLEIPMVILYRLAPLSYWLGRMLVKVPFIGLPNILSGRGIVREFIQHEATPLNLAHEVERIIEDPVYRARMKTDLANVKAQLGPFEGSEALARLAASLLPEPCP